MGRDIAADVKITERDLRAYVVDPSIGIENGDFDAALTDLVMGGIISESIASHGGKLQIQYSIGGEVETFIQGEYARLTRELLP